MKIRMAVLAAFLFFLGGPTGQAAAAGEPFLLDWIIYGKHAPFFTAQDKGFFKKAGLDVAYKRGFGSGDTIKKVGAKAARLGFADASSLVSASPPPRPGAPSPSAASSPWSCRCPTTHWAGSAGACCGWACAWP